MGGDCQRSKGTSWGAAPPPYSPLMFAPLPPLERDQQRSIVDGRYGKGDQPFREKDWTVQCRLVVPQRRFSFIFIFTSASHCRAWNAPPAKPVIFFSFLFPVCLCNSKREFVAKKKVPRAGRDIRLVSSPNRPLHLPRFAFWFSFFLFFLPPLLSKNGGIFVVEIKKKNKKEKEKRKESGAKSVIGRR